MIRLYWVVDATENVQEFDLQDPVVIGRRGENDVCIPDGRVSRSHGALFWRDDALWLVNLSQRNRIIVYQNEQAYSLPPEAEITLDVGAQFDISHVRFWVEPA
ncbi:MAG: FHA domain-containing protein [Anaerolineales bacterium]